MTYVQDGDPFVLTFGADEVEPGFLAIGWLDEAQPFARGAVSPEFVQRLRQLCRNGINRTRGFHRCNLCPAQEGGAMRAPTVVRDASGEYFVGSAEIRVTTPSGARYAAPDMIIHYVEEHDYSPPADFVEAVVRG